MPYNKPKYNTRNTGRYNTPGQFVSAGELGAAPAPPLPPQKRLTAVSFDTSNYMPPKTEVVALQNNAHMQQQNVPKTEPFAADNDVSMPDAQTDRPGWMKPKLTGVVKKISNKERRRRQNKKLRKLLTPKNALMVLNEMMPGEQILNQIKMVATENQGNYRSAPQQFTAELVLDGQVYRGTGGNKAAANNAVAEVAIRYLMLKKLARAAEPPKDVSMEGEEEDDESLPMMQLASYALHRLFAEWEAGGVKVPQLRPSTASTSDTDGQLAAAGVVIPKLKTPKPPKTKELPADAGSMHPCMLLTHMRYGLEYRDLEVEGDKPQNMMFTVGVEVDGIVYSGKAANKKAARKAAARAACETLFGVHFDSC